MKMMGQVKEANRFLRGIDFDEATDSLKKIEVDSNSFLNLFYIIQLKIILGSARQRNT